MLKVTYRFKIALLLFIPLLIAILIGITSYLTMQKYYEVRPLWVEHGAFLQYPGLLHLKNIKNLGVLKATTNLFTSRERHILQPALLGVVSPGLLGWPYAHLIIVLPALYAFLVLGSTLQWRRSGHISFATVSLLPILAIPGFTGVWVGVGTPFAENQAMLLMACAMLCLIHAFIKYKRIWIAGFISFAVLSVLSRTTVLIFFIVIGTPLIILQSMAIIKKYRNVPIKLLSYIWPHILAISVLIMLWIWFGQSLIGYYLSPGVWSLGHGFWETLESIRSQSVNYFGQRWLLYFAVLLLLSFVFRYRFFSKLQNCDKLNSIFIWWIFGFMGLLALGGFATDLPKEMAYLVPPLILLVLPIKDGFITSTSKHWFLRYYTIGILLCSLSFFSINTSAEIQKIVSPTDYDRSLLLSQQTMAKLLSEFPDGTTWAAYTRYDWGIPVTLTTFYRYGKIQLPKGRFYNGINYWDTAFPDTTAITRRNIAYENAQNEVDVAFVIKDFHKSPLGMDDYSFSIASWISEKIQRESQWVYIRDVSGEPFGSMLAAYKNEARIKRVFSTQEL